MVLGSLNTKFNALRLRRPQAKAHTSGFLNLCPEGHRMATFHACDLVEPGPADVQPTGRANVPAEDRASPIRIERRDYEKFDRKCRSKPPSASRTQPSAIRMEPLRDEHSS